MMGASAGEGNLAFFAPFFEVLVDELAASV
jgi:hypothetical protein